jgi:4-hydroxybenzoate polyprenyltransferase
MEDATSKSTLPSEVRPADAVPNSWVEQMPEPVRPYLRLARLDRPVGIWLLFWPCAWATLLASAQPGAFVQTWPALLWQLVFFGLGALVMRSAGCAYNDIVDRDLDAQVARTRARPVAAGHISLKRAWLCVMILCLIGLGVLLSFDWRAVLVGLFSIVLVVLYPFMKRITWWPQAWLGLTFNWGVLVAWMAVQQTLGLAAFFLYAAGVFWTLGYDTLYALQDLEDDALAGIRSSARRLGAGVGLGVALFYALSVACAFIAFEQVGGYGAMLAVLPFAGHLALQLGRLDTQDPIRALGLFRANQSAGLLLSLGALGVLLVEKF